MFNGTGAVYLHPIQTIISASLLRNESTIRSRPQFEMSCTGCRCSNDLNTNLATLSASVFIRLHHRIYHPCVCFGLHYLLKCACDCLSRLIVVIYKYFNNNNNKNNNNNNNFCGTFIDETKPERWLLLTLLFNVFKPCAIYIRGYKKIIIGWHKPCYDLLDYPVMCHITTAESQHIQKCWITQLWITQLWIISSQIHDWPPTWTRHVFLHHYPCLQMTSFWLHL